jgi:hypothetical protein
MDFYENTIKANEYWFNAFWEPWLRQQSQNKKRGGISKMGSIVKR